MIGRTLSHYEVKRSLGAGGMGEVYLARDLALGRQVALKVMHRDLDVTLRGRLLVEARACARLQHPSIATFYESGEADGVGFLAMEYVEGETLRSRLKRGRLEPPQALGVVFCLLEALVHAHAARLLHRDIKPENIIVRADGSAKLLDFGLAKLTRLDSGQDIGDASTVSMQTDLTLPGQLLGTVGYMSPEQLRGESLDERSDVFAVGIVLYECLAGLGPFHRRSPMESIAAILSKDPPPLPADIVSPDLAHIVGKSLSRDADQRYASASLFLSDLRKLKEGESVAESVPSLAIIDFENLTKVSEDDWIGIGVAESLTADLSGLSGLSLVPRERVIKTRADLVAGQRLAEAIDLGRALGCRWVLSGGFQKMARSLRVTARLYDATTGEMLGAEKVDGNLDEIFELQDRLAARIACRLDVSLEEKREPVGTDPQVEAYKLYTRGRQMFSRLQKGSFEQIGELYQRALEIEPEYAPVLAGLSGLSAMRYLFTADPRVLEDSIELARKAIKKDPKQHDAYIWLGYSLLRSGRHTEALEAEEIAMRLNPDGHFPPYFAGVCFSAMGKLEEALELFQLSVGNNPGYPFAWLMLGWTHLERGSSSEAKWCFERCVTLETEINESATTGAATFLAECLRRMGQTDQARKVCMEALIAVEKMDHALRDMMRGLCLCVLGRTALEQDDRIGATAAFQQVLVQMEGRPNVISGGYLVVMAKAGLARSGGDGTAFEEALSLFESKNGYEFSFSPGTTDGVALLDLARAAADLGRLDDAHDLLERARGACSGEAATWEIP